MRPHWALALVAPLLVGGAPHSPTNQEWIDGALDIYATTCQPVPADPVKCSHLKQMIDARILAQSQSKSKTSLKKRTH
jgi:hypothetical protein